MTLELIALKKAAEKGQPKPAPEIESVKKAKTKQDKANEKAAATVEESTKSEQSEPKEGSATQKKEEDPEKQEQLKQSQPKTLYQAIIYLQGELCFDPTSTRAFIKTTDGAELRVRSIAQSVSIRACRRIAEGKTTGRYTLWPGAGKNNGYTLCGTSDVRDEHEDECKITGKYKGFEDGKILIGVGRNFGKRKIKNIVPISLDTDLPDWKEHQWISLVARRNEIEWVWSGETYEALMK